MNPLLNIGVESNNTTTFIGKNPVGIGPKLFYLVGFVDGWDTLNEYQKDFADIYDYCKNLYLSHNVRAITEDITKSNNVRYDVHLVTQLCDKYDFEFGLFFLTLDRASIELLFEVADELSEYWNVPTGKIPLVITFTSDT